MEKSFGSILGHHKPLILLFSLTILLPALLLGIFGLRTAGSDSYRLERYLQQEQQAVLGQLRKDLQDRLNNLGGRLEELLANAGGETVDWADLCRLLSSPEGRATVPGTVLSLSSTGALIDVGAGYAYSTGLPGSARDDRLWEAQRLEFTASELGKAVQTYRRIADDSKGEPRMLALNGLGRALARSGNDQLARAAYLKLLQEWPPVLSAETAVYPLMAGLQLGRLTGRLGLAQEDVPLLIGVYERLFDDPRVVDRDLVTFYEDAYRKLLDPLCAERETQACRRYDVLRAGRSSGLQVISGRRELTDRLVPILRSISIDQSQARQGVIPVVGWNGLLVFALRDKREPKGGGELLATALSEEDLARLLKGWISRSNVDGVQIQIRRPSGALAVATLASPPQAPFLEEEIGGGFAGWVITLFHGPDSASRTLIESSRRLYLSFALGLMALLLGGTLLTVRAVVKEQEVARLKAGFVSVVSHEFKSPVTSIAALLEGLRDGLVRDPGRQQLYYGVIASELQRLTRLINNLLDFSKIGAGDKVYFPVETDLEELVDRILMSFEPRAKRKGFTIERDLPGSLDPVVVDPDAISQVILNLLDNAVKYSLDERFVRLAVRQTDNHVEIEVEDRGQGIPTEEQAQIFQSSFRGADGKQFGVPGAGIGLAVVKHVVEAHDGTVVVRSSTGAGAIFTVRLSMPGSGVKGPGRPGAARQGQSVLQSGGRNEEDPDHR